MPQIPQMLPAVRPASCHAPLGGVIAKENDNCCRSRGNNNRVQPLRKGKVFASRAGLLVRLTELIPAVQVFLQQQQQRWQPQSPPAGVDDPDKFIINADLLLCVDPANFVMHPRHANVCGPLLCGLSYEEELAPYLSSPGLPGPGSKNA